MPFFPVTIPRAITQSKLKGGALGGVNGFSTFACKGKKLKPERGKVVRAIPQKEQNKNEFYLGGLNL
jgi:hypothetical protein